MAMSSEKAASNVGSGQRIKGLTIVKPIVYGNIARYLGKNNEHGHSHQWKVFVKPYENEDMSAYVKEVHFKFHDSFAIPKRIISKPPYEITETGWGEFNVAIRIYFQDPVERPVSFKHNLKLFPSPVINTDLSKWTVDSTKKSGAGNVPLVSEFYDELVFTSPTELMRDLLTNVEPIASGHYSHYTDFEKKKEEALRSMGAAKQQVRSEIEQIKEQLKLAQETLAKFRMEVEAVQAPQPKHQPTNRKQH